MDNQHIKQLSLRLLQGGIAPARVRRFISETEDHYQDLLNAGKERGLSQAKAAAEASKVLGDHERLANEMLRQDNLRTFTSRHPYSLLLLPLLNYLAAYLVVALVLVISIHTYGDDFTVIKGTFTAGLAQAVAWFLMYLLPVLITGAFMRQLIACQRPLALVMVGCLLVCMLGAMVNIVLGFPAEANGPGSIGLAIGWKLVPALELSNPWCRLMLTFALLSPVLFLYHSHCKREYV